MASVGGLMMKAGRRAAQYYIDTGECLFCSASTTKHEGHCAFSGYDREGLIRMVGILDHLNEAPGDGEAG
jgi:hypothetical protein